MAVAEKLGFDFGLGSSGFFKIFLFLLLFLIIWETKKRWSEIGPMMKDLSSGIKKGFLTKTKEIQKEIIAFSPQKLAGRAGGLITSVIAVMLVVFISLRQFLKTFIFRKHIIILTGFCGIVFDIFVADFTSDLLIILLIGLWILSIQLYKLEARVSATGALICLVICPFLLIFDKELIAEKATIWAYIFLAIGIGQFFFQELS